MLYLLKVSILCCGVVLLYFEQGRVDVRFGSDYFVRSGISVDLLVLEVLFPDMMIPVHVVVVVIIASYFSGIVNATIIIVSTSIGTE